ncbi:MAG: hypothetical protein R2877_04550 [Bdellovibrionota bacterium]
MMVNAAPETDTSEEEQPSAEPKQIQTQPAPSLIAKSSVGPKHEYRMFTPEELQKIANQISSDSSEELYVIKGEVFSFWAGTAMFKK